jgi:4-amino-4-deoxy-L-arabinose transferase-like glycosyltransferase
MQFFPTLTKKHYLYLFLLVFIYLATRLYNLTSLPIFVDEAIYSRWSQIALHDASWRFISLTDGKQPLWVWVSMAPLKLFSDPLFATRLTSVLSGLIGMLGLVYTGFLLKNIRLGFIASSLYLLTPFLFFYDRFATMESMLTASGIWLLNLGIILIKTQRLDVALILGLAGGLAMLTKSPALVYLLLIPITYPFLATTPFKVKKIARFLILSSISLVLTAGIYNIQRLSPWMHMIADKNNDFVVSPISMLRDNPYRIIQNFTDAQSWLWAYLTPPIYLLGVVGIYLLLKANLMNFFVYSAWFWGPLMATVTTAMLFRPRYIVFAAPFALLYAAFALSKLRFRRLILAFTFLSIFPLRFYYLAYTNPDKMPLVRADSDYTSGWAAGRGVKEMSDYLVAIARNSTSDVEVYTEGTFGLLPHGLELYSDGLANNLKITGLYPINEIPPIPVIKNAAKNQETYFILNNTQVKSLPPNSREIMSIKKADESYIRLYKINP